MIKIILAYKCFVGLTMYYGIFKDMSHLHIESRKYMGIFNERLSISQSNVMDLNNVMSHNVKPILIMFQ